jgi:sulfate adenylyltransferase subunit 2
VDYLSRMESDSIYVIREAYNRYSRLAMLWSMGKDSTALLWMVRQAFFGKVPIPVVHIDTSYKFPEIYAFRDRLTTELGLDLRVARNEDALADGMGPKKIDKFACCNALKTTALKQAIAGMGFDALLLGIRRDEHGVRAKERYFSPRKQDFTWSVGNQPPELWDLYASVDEAAHDRIHPLLHMTELDIWRYIRRENVPVNPLYLAKEGKRYRSIGCAPCCMPIASTASTVDDIIAELEASREPERAGRAQDKEDAFTMQKLRSLGYM